MSLNNELPKMRKMLSVEMPDGSKWGFPVEMIARDRAAHYAYEFNDDVERSLEEDTLLLFEADVYAIEDWAVNNMNWDDFKGHQFKLSDDDPPDFQDGWMSGKKEIIEVPL